ncbi:MAG: hypothetical protein WD354_03625, partial [Acidimicrobiia bacterium]
MSGLWFAVQEWETQLDGLPGLRRDIWTKALFVLLAVLAFLSLGAAFSLPARADLIDVVIDQVEEVIETATTTVAGDDAAPLQEVVEEVVPPVAEEAVEVVDVVPPLLEEAVELVDAVPPIVDEVVEVIPPLEEAIELETVIPPVGEIV